MEDKLTLAKRALEQGVLSKEEYELFIKHYNTYDKNYDTETNVKINKNNEYNNIFNNLLTYFFNLINNINGFNNKLIYMVKKLFSRRRSRQLLLVLLFFFSLWIIAIISVNPTGFVVFNGTTELNNNSSFELTINNNSYLVIEGYYYDYFNKTELYLLKETQNYLLNKTNISSNNNSIKNDNLKIIFSTKEPRAIIPYLNYHPNENIFVNTFPETNFSIWVDDGFNKLPVFNGFSLNEGVYNITILMNYSNNIIKEELPLIINNSNKTLRKTYFKVCAFNCSLINGTFKIKSNNKVLLTNISILNEKNINHKPTALTIPDIYLDSKKELNLDNYFVDSDGDKLTYEINNMIGINETINNSILILEPKIPGTYEATIYASDGKELSMNNFLIVVPDKLNNTTNNSLNDSNNSSINNNVSLNNNITNNNTNTDTINNSLLNNNISNGTNNNLNNINKNNLCSSLDPNKNSVDCLLNSSTNYFLEQSIFLKDKNNKIVAKLTPIGNLMIKGDYYENALVNPSYADFTIGYLDDDYNYRPTIWISNKGDLYLKGKLYEINNNIIPKPGAYTIKNKKGIVLLWADQKSGDLYLRGNIIPYRKRLT